MQASASPDQGGQLGKILDEYVRSERITAALRSVLLELANAGARISALIAKGPLGRALAADTGLANRDGDAQKALDILANEIVIDALRSTSTAYYVSEELDAVSTLDPRGELAVAVDPLDGSSNIDANISIGTIFSIFGVSPNGASASFLRPGREQLAAGYFIYGPHTALVLTVRDGVDLYVLDAASREFQLARTRLSIPASTNEFAINASNYRHWFDPVRNFIDDCLDGAKGPRGKDFNMRWIASLIAEAHRILSRGGIFLYPSDQRPGYENGRLRLVYEAAPIALIMEQAGGQASDGSTPILDKIPRHFHERTPLIFGSAEKVARIASYYVNPEFQRQISPLFGRRGLFRS